MRLDILDPICQNLLWQGDGHLTYGRQDGEPIAEGTFGAVYEVIWLGKA